jgi:hypothetical protein
MAMKADGAGAGMGGGGRAMQQQFRSEEKRIQLANKPFNAAASISSVASASQVGELFEYTVGSVSLPRQRSAMIPILNESIKAVPLSIYNQSVQARFPLYGVRLNNNTHKHLLQGPVTVFDAQGHYAGDASIDNVPPGQQRLLSYGVDLQLLMDATQNHSVTNIVSGRIVKGVLMVSHRTVSSQEYLAQNKGSEDKTLVIEHPVRGGWKLVEGKDQPKPIETTPSVMRFEGKVAAGKSTKLVVQEEIVQGQEIALIPADVGQLVVYAQSGQIDPKVKDVLMKAIDLKNAMTDTQRQMSQKQEKINEINSEQPRIRENMKTVAQNSEYYTRMMKKLDDQETQLEGHQKDLESLRVKFEEQRKHLEDYLGTMNVG